MDDENKIDLFDNKETPPSVIDGQDVEIFDGLD